MKRIAIAVLLAFLAYVPAANGQIENTQTLTKTGTAAAQFLKIGVDARAMAMGGAYTGMSGGLGSMYWNPAGLGELSTMEAMFSHHEWLADINYNHIAFALSMGSFGTLGASFTSLTMPQEAVRTVDEPDGTGEFFDAGDIALNLSYARQLTDKFSIGGNVKYIQQNIWHSSARAVAADIGALFITPFRGIRLGASISNFGSDMRMSGRDLIFSEDPDPFNEGNVRFVNAGLETDAFPLPLVFRVGLSGEVMQSDNMRLSFAVDALEPNDNTSAVNAGFEYALNELLFLRGGYNSLFQTEEYSEAGASFGAGLQYRVWGNTNMLKVDYAYADYGLLDTVQQFTVSMQF